MESLAIEIHLMKYQYLCAKYLNRHDKGVILVSAYIAAMGDAFRTPRIRRMDAFCVLSKAESEFLEQLPYMTDPYSILLPLQPTSTIVLLYGYRLAIFLLHKNHYSSCGPPYFVQSSVQTFKTSKFVGT